MKAVTMLKPQTLLSISILICFFWCGIMSAQKVQPNNSTVAGKPLSKNLIKLAGEPIPGAEIYVELEPDDEPIANINCMPKLSLVENENNTVTATISCAELLPATHYFQFTGSLNLVKLYKISATENNVSGTVVFEYNNKRTVVRATFVRGQASPTIVAKLTGTPAIVIIKGERMNNQLDLQADPKKGAQ